MHARFSIQQQTHVRFQLLKVHLFGYAMWICDPRMRNVWRFGGHQYMVLEAAVMGNIAQRASILVG